MSEKISNDAEWRERAAELRKHGVPSQRANVVALREQGYSYGKIASELKFGKKNNDRSQVKYHIDKYVKQHKNAEWLVEHGPEV